MGYGVWGYLLYTSFGLQLQHHRDNHFSFPLCEINVFILVRFNAVYVSGACELFSLHRLCCADTRSSYSIQTYIWVTFKLPNAISCKNATIYVGLMAKMPKIQTVKLTATAKYVYSKVSYTVISWQQLSIYS